MSRVIKLSSNRKPLLEDETAKWSRFAPEIGRAIGGRKEVDEATNDEDGDRPSIGALPSRRHLVGSKVD